MPKFSFIFAALAVKLYCLCKIADFYELTSVTTAAAPEWYSVFCACRFYALKCLLAACMYFAKYMCSSPSVPLHLPAWLSAYLSSAHLYCTSPYLSICLQVSLLICRSAYLSIFFQSFACLSRCLLTICLPFHLPTNFICYLLSG